MNFAERYGPWAVIAGASEGTGREFAKQVAAHGVNVMLIARRELPLLALREEIVREHKVECRILSADLSAPEAAANIIDAADGLDVGLFISNAGADTHHSLFLNKGVDDWLRLIALNTLTPLQCCHHFAAAMCRRGKGGILLVGSGACHVSGPHMATYSATKGFNLRFAEGLWAELQPCGVDVLFYALGRTDTPMFRAHLADQGLPLPSGLADPVEVARVGLARLPHGPGADWGVADDAPGPGGISAASRRERVSMIARITQEVFRQGVGDGEI